MSKHTPGRMVQDTRGAPKADVRAASGRAVAHTYMASGRPPKTKEAYQDRVDEDRANARRIVACWNACEGVDTEWLEQCGGDESTRMFSLPHWVKHADELRTQLDELLMCLQEYVSASKRDGATASGTYIKSCAAINKVKGQS